ncbi:MAG: AMP-binding protein [Proteobacteria bacterium]|nr:AMP-binding protein [Pseudomonadota bacterium]
MGFDRDTDLHVFNVTSAVAEAARKWGDRVVLHHYDTDATVTYEEVHSMSNRLGNRLRALGVEIENRIAILMEDCPEWAYIFLGALKIGAVAAPLNTLLAEKDYAFYLADSRAKVLFVGASLFDKIEGIIGSLPYLKQVVVFGDGSGVPRAGRIVDWESFVQDAPEELEIEPTFSNDMACFVYTSGSTGRPRAIVHSQNNMALAALQPEKLRGVREGDIQFHVPKMYFNVCINGLLSTFYNGSSMVLVSGRPDPLTVLEVIRKYRPTMLTAPPTMLVRMIETGKGAPHLTDLSSLKYIFCTGEALSPALFQRFRELFGKTPYNCWGMQELNASGIAWQFGEEVPPDKVGSNGRSTAPGVEVKIVDESGNEVPAGEKGELLVKAESLFLYYWHNPEETANRMYKGWFRAGDFFMRDVDRYYWYLGRSDEMVKIAGRQVFPAEVESTVGRHPAVLENAVVPIENEMGLYELRTFVVLKEGYEPSPELASAIKGFVKDQLAPYKRPHHVAFVSDLPKTATGKIQRFRLREEAVQKEKVSQ